MNQFNGINVYSSESLNKKMPFLPFTTSYSITISCPGVHFRAPLIALGMFMCPVPCDGGFLNFVIVFSVIRIMTEMIFFFVIYPINMVIFK